MAQKIVVELDIQGGAISNLDQIEQAASSGGASLQAMKKELREIQGQLLALEPGTEEFVKLSQQAGEVRDKMNNVAESINANAGPAVETLGNNFSLLTGKLKNLDFDGAAESLKAIGGNISNIKFSDFTNGIKSIGSSLATVGKALLTNPIFLIGAAIAAAVVYSKELLSLVDGISSADQELLANQKERAELSKQQLDAVSEQENILRLQGKSEKEILQLKIEASKVAIADLEAQLETQKQMRQSQIDAAKRNKEILSGIVQFLTIPLQAILFTIDKIAEFAGFETNLRDQLNDAVSSLLFDPEEVAAEADKSIAETEKALTALKNQQAGFQLSVNQINKQAADERKKEREAQLKAEQDAADERLKIEQRTQDAIRAAREQRLNEEEALSEEIFQLGLTQQERELMAIRDTYFEKIALAEQFGLDTTALLDEQKRLEMEVNKKYAEEEVKVAEITNEKKLELASAVVGSIIQLNEALAGSSEASARRAFAITKSLSLAQAIMSTYAAINAVLKDPLLVGPARFAAAAAAGITGFANVVKIAGTKFTGGGGGGSQGGGGQRPTFSSGGGGSTPAPFNPLNTQFINNRPEQVTPAYVLAGDVKTQTEARQKIEDRARL